MAPLSILGAAFLCLSSALALPQSYTYGGHNTGHDGGSNGGHYGGHNSSHNGGHYGNHSVCAGNTANDRSMWCNHDLSTDYYENSPDTGVVREYWLEITNITAAPDGFERVVLAVNGTVPGPKLEGNWGDTFRVHIHNALENNGTGIHWHGIRQFMNVGEDGTPSITQCPIAPGDSYTYEWKAEQYGTTWYHSHFKIQAWMGVFGPIVIHGPASANYDEDLGTIFLNDWSHETVDALHGAEETSGPPQFETGLFNGVGMYDGAGSRYQTVFTPGKSHRIRLINAAMDSEFRFSIDGHKLTIIANDLVPVEPYETDSLEITMGQRYDVIVTADQPTGDYWMRAWPQEGCSSILNTTAPDVKAIVRYDAGSTADPADNPVASAFDSTCTDMPPEALIPTLQKTVGPDPDGVIDVLLNLTGPLPGSNEPAGSVFQWTLDGSTMLVQWEEPSLKTIYDNRVEPQWETNDNVYELNGKDEWVYFVLQSTPATAGFTGGIVHPIHLHGHDFFVLAQASNAAFDASTPLNLNNPPRRDTAVLPAYGYLVMAFKTDNPGAWLMHCHIGWHASEGLAVQFIERYDEIRPLIDGTKLEQTCKNWDAYQQATGVEEGDSGI